MIDILYLAHGRRKFTEASLAALTDGTRREEVATFQIYTDCLPPFPDEGWPVEKWAGMKAWANHAKHGGPVAIMKDFLSNPGTDIFAKIDNDVIVPPGWLEAATAVMLANPDLEFLGLEPPASRTRNPGTQKRVTAPESVFENVGYPSRGYVDCDAIGGVGLMRRSAFTNRPAMVPSGPRGVGGFTNWQQENKVRAGWIVPPLKLFLLDRLPFEPWLSLAKQYNASGISRPWTNYDPADVGSLWGWWLK